MLLCSARLGSAPTKKDPDDHTTVVRLTLPCLCAAEGHGHLLRQPERGHVGHPAHRAPLRLRLRGGRRQRAGETCRLLQPLSSLRSRVPRRMGRWMATGVFFWVFLAFSQHGGCSPERLHLRSAAKKGERERKSQVM